MTWAVVLAGGSGSRFWPRSTPTLPKQCLVLEGDRSLVQATVDRLVGLIPADNILVVTGQPMEAAVRAQLPELAADQFLVESSAKNTAPAIAWAAREVIRRGGDVMVVLPADHRITDVSALRDVISRAVEHARTHHHLVLLGESPTRPEVGFGYIVCGAPCGTGSRVERFEEKPPRQRARDLIAQGALWNSGMFVWRVVDIQDAFDAHLPGLWDRVCTDWDGVQAVSVDRGILERSDKVSVIACAVGWDDLGSWRAAAALEPRAERVVALDAEEVVIDAPGRTVAVLGVSDVVIVDDGEVLLVMAKEEAHRVDEIRLAMEAKTAE